jgi:dTMP kinase
MIVSHIKNFTFIEEKTMGIFITFEGGEGSGKTTQIKLLKNQLADEGYNVHVTREPGGTEISDKIRKILVERENAALVPLAELLLYEASRAQHVEEFILPVMKEEKAVVLCDRFYDATSAYQAGARSLETDLVNQLNMIATKGLKPNLTFYIDIDPKIGVKRAKDRMAEVNSNEDRFEREKLEFHYRVRDAYLEIAKSNEKRVKIINGEGTIEELNKTIMEHIKCYLKK